MSFCFAGDSDVLVLTFNLVGIMRCKVKVTIAVTCLDLFIDYEVEQGWCSEVQRCFSLRQIDMLTFARSALVVQRC